MCLRIRTLPIQQHTVVISISRLNGQNVVCTVIGLFQKCLALPEKVRSLRILSQRDGIGTGIGQHCRQCGGVLLRLPLQRDGLLECLRRLLVLTGGVQNPAIVVLCRGQRRHISVGLTQGLIQLDGLLLVIGSRVVISQHTHGCCQLFIVCSHLILRSRFVCGQQQNLLNLPGIVLQNS